jgi:hypothetical protein
MHPALPRRAGPGAFCRMVAVAGAFHVETHFIVVPEWYQPYD